LIAVGRFHVAESTARADRRASEAASARDVARDLCAPLSGAHAERFAAAALAVRRERERAGAARRSLGLALAAESRCSDDLDHDERPRHAAPRYPTPARIAAGQSARGWWRPPRRAQRDAWGRPARGRRRRSTRDR